MIELQARVIGGFEQQAFSQFEFQQARRQLFFLEDAGNGGHEIGVGELLGRQIDRHLQVAQPVVAQVLAHSAGLACHPFANRNNQPGFFRHADELVRANHAFFRVVPAQQGLHAEQTPGSQAQLGLIEHLEFVLGEGAAQVVLNEKFVAGFGVQGLGEDLYLMFAVGFGFVQGQPGVAHQCLRIEPVQRRTGNAD